MTMGSICEPLDLSNFTQQDMWYQQLIFEAGFQSGVPTNTTPTLTPTTLRTLEQSLINMESDDLPYHNEAGFVPPIVQPTNPAGSICHNVLNTTTLQGGSTTVIPSITPLSRPSVVTSSMSTPNDNVNLGQPMTSGASTSTVRKNVGGRRPTKAQGISPEEEERRQLRRERNKAAAARCRKRRMDQTSSLENETKGLEEKRQQLQIEIRDLTHQKEELEHLLEAHKRTGCKMSSTGLNGLSIPCGPASPPDIKPIVPICSASKPGCLVVKQEIEVVDSLVFNPTEQYMHPQYCPTASIPKKTGYGLGNATKPSRPTSLNVAAAFTPAQPNFRAPSGCDVSEVAGIPISTPSTGIFNYDSLMEGGTGLTPVSGPLIPSCSSQQRNHNSVGDLSSPDSNISNKLVSL